ncbi:hypothetical protein [Hyphomicrobium sp.]|uniref:hypothetical protein n=1 Tax=Hyphomicrobium sp. TaxID=82 RepID=UPI001323DE8B|nr:hypothetical protein [Hyphomicrobium sp.]KAB2937402.1 MAG: hypothetical protein F9K20_20130 [Hyphomicrobium sp.]
MAQGVRAPNLPTSSVVLELVGIKDLGGGLRQVVRIALVDLLAWLETAFGVVAARSASDAARAIGLANSAIIRVRLLDAAIAKAAADARRALGLANNTSMRLNHLDDVQIVLRAQVFN